MANNVGVDVVPSASWDGESDKAHVKWAWSMTKSSRAARTLLHDINTSSVRSELLEVAKLLSSCTIGTQTTMEPSYTMQLHNVQMETEKCRSIGNQCGYARNTENASTQAVEADLATGGGTNTNKIASNRNSTSPPGLQPDEDTDIDDYFHINEERRMLPTNDSFNLVASTGGSACGQRRSHSCYVPNSNIPIEQFPDAMSLAQSLGVSNRYGFIQLPRAQFELPPRRFGKFVSPVEYSHLIGSHDLRLAEPIATQLHRAHALWTQSCGFVPKF